MRTDLDLRPPRAVPDVDVRVLEADLRARVDGEVRFDAGSRGAYATDGSNYRQVPIAVVVPRSVEAGATAVAVCRDHDAPVLSRGGGTSLGGQCTNTAVVIDWSKYCNRLVSVDPQARTCVVEPGIVLDDLNRELAPHGLVFGPKPATHDHCTLGGMIGNNSCGATAQAYGKTADNVRRLEILTYRGWRSWVGATGDDELATLTHGAGDTAQLYRTLVHLRDRYSGLVRDRYPDIPRRVSGYSLDALLPEQGFDLAKLLVGSEGTLATVLHAELQLVPVLEHTAMLVLGFPDVIAAADAVPGILANCSVSPVLLEAMDQRMAELMRNEHVHLDSLAALPEGEAWLLVQFGADDPDSPDEQAASLLDALGRSRDDPGVVLTDDPAREAKMLDAREAGLGVTARPVLTPETWEGWEDSAVAPEHLGDYLRDLRRLFAEFDLDRPSLYGHFGHGCVHTRIPFRLKSATGVAEFRRFLERAADLVVSYGGSLSGEHGDGQARGELLERMFGPELVRAFGELKALFDPENRMNPGKVVAPYRVDENLRLGAGWRPQAHETWFGYPHDKGSFTAAVMRCVGVGACRRSVPGDGVMCPSYQVTREEEHSTRGRARLLFEMLQGHADSPVRDGFRSEAVRDALDLCLACKGCKSDCPVGVDMATYKAEFLAHHYAGRLRPMAHYALGWLPTWARLARVAPRAVNALLHAPGVARLGKRLAGIAVERDAPAFATETFQDWWHRQGRPAARPGDPDTVVLWPDTFTNHFEPHIARAAVDVLEHAGFRVAVPDEPLCCGLTWISTGQLGVARRRLQRTIAALRPWIEAGHLVVGLEPSCSAVFRSDAAELLPEDEDVARLQSRFVTLAEALVHHAPRPWRPERHERAAIVQAHCHQHAVLGFDADVEAMSRAGIDARRLESGCCGLAGNFGFEAGHYDVSMACAEQALLPAVRAADPDTLVLADGFSCRTQIEQGATGRRGMHLAEVLSRSIADTPTAAPSHDGHGAAIAGGALAATTAVAAAVLARRAGRRPVRGGAR
ncbi:FAD-binding and (Fe-S)-binding domain-containing protein [Pseudonocardia adelaidensis]|uniref:FAD-binding and (Fe-S)-binding domain-containing protein n=1 Tax=Pseudonocardia adelaidensis TaxID=648754 RepID=A0ABP9NPG4_9PSEU